jgi:hypothetical protein
MKAIFPTMTDLEEFVFHGTPSEKMPLILQGGFKIGGVDVEVAVGQRFGQGADVLSVAKYTCERHVEICVAWVDCEVL